MLYPSGSVISSFSPIFPLCFSLDGVWLPTIQPSGVVLLRTYSWARSHGPEQGRIGAHEIHVNSSIQCAIWREGGGTGRRATTTKTSLGVILCRHNQGNSVRSGVLRQLKIQGGALGFVNKIYSRAWISLKVRQGNDTGCACV